MLSVEDSSMIGKYILLGMYNTTADGNLVKELLGVDELRPEWVTARRAGTEEAPSFQWLVEVKQVIDKHTIELCRPLLRDCLMNTNLLSTMLTCWKIFTSDVFVSVVDGTDCSVIMVFHFIIVYLRHRRWIMGGMPSI